MKLSYKIISCVLFLFFASAITMAQSKSCFPSKQPVFKNQKKLIDHLMKTYQCEKIEFNNWEVFDNRDSCLNICLVNSAKVPKSSGSSDLLKIASLLKASITNAKEYNNYYVIFVKEEDIFGEKARSHTLGSQLSSKSL